VGGWTYKSDGGEDPLWDRMKGKIGTDLGRDERTDRRWRPNVGDERQGLALADGSEWRRRPCLELLS
jgi:hypothetical protein